MNKKYALIIRIEDAAPRRCGIHEYITEYESKFLYGDKWYNDGMDIYYYVNNHHNYSVETSNCLDDLIEKFCIESL